MKLTRKIAAVAVSSLMMFSVAGITASAATVTQDGLNVSLTTDKTEYKKDEAITATLTVENTGGASVKDVKLENVVPEGYELAKDYTLTKSVDELKSNDKAELKVVYNAKTGGNVTPSNNNTATNNNNNAVTTSSGATVESPKTGDNTEAIVFVLLLLVSVGAGLLCFKTKKGRQFLSVALCVSVLGTIIAVVPFEINAAENAIKSIIINEDITCNNKNLTIKSIISYLFDDPTSDEDKVGEISYKQIDSKHIVYDETESIYYIDNRLLLTAVEGSSKSNIESLVANYQGKIVGCIELTDDYQIEFDKAYTKEVLQNMADELKNSRLVSDCYINQVSEVQFDLIPNDEKWEKENWTKKNGNDINWGVEAIDAMGAWDHYKDMEAVNVGIIDTMFDTKHEDIKFAKVWNNPVDILKENDPTIQFHGTHVSGTMAATFNNKIGIAGVAPKTKIFAYSILGEQTDEQIKYTNLSDFYQWKYALSKLITNGCKVINVSMCNHDDTKHQSEVYGVFLNKFIRNKYEFVIVQSAGNDGNKNIPSRLAENSGLFTGIDIKEVKDRIIVVGAAGNKANSQTISNSDNYNLANFSSYGKRVDIIAPGVKVYSTVPPLNRYENSNTAFEWSGTSMAAPHVSGIAAMCFSVNKNLTGTQVKKIITSTADNTPIYRTVDGKEDKTLAYYMANAKNAVEKAIKENGHNHYQSIAEYGTVIGSVSLQYKAKPEKGVKITAYHVDENEVSGISLEDWVTYSDKDGNFDLILPPSKYKLIVTYDGYDPYGIIVDVKEHETNLLEDIKLLTSIETFSINGIIKDEDGNLIDGATIRLDSDINSESKETQSKNGKYSIDLTQKSFSNVWVSVEKESYKPFATILSLEKKDTKFNVTLEKAKPKTYSAADLVELTVPEIIQKMNDKVEFVSLTDPGICFYNDDVFPGMRFWVNNTEYPDANTLSKLKAGKYELSDITLSYGSADRPYDGCKVSDDLSIGMTFADVVKFIGDRLFFPRFDIPPHSNGTLPDKYGFGYYYTNDKYVAYLYFINTNNLKSNPLYSNEVYGSLTLDYAKVYKIPNDEWRTLYKEMITTEFRNNHNDSEYNNTCFNLYDVNNDKIPELFVRWRIGYDAYEEQYTIINGKVVRFEPIDFESSCEINPKSEWIMFDHYYIRPSFDEESYRFYKIENGKIKCSEVFLIQNNSGYYIDYQKVSKDDFYTKIAEYDYGSNAKIDVKDSPWVGVFNDDYRSINPYITSMSGSFSMRDFEKMIDAWLPND